MVRRRFRTQYHKDPPTDKPIRTWCNNFEQTVSLSADKRWIGRASQDDSPPLPWPPRSPDLTSCDYVLWGYVKDHMFVPHMPLDLAELQQRIEHAVTGIDHQMLVRVWQKLDYRIDICRVTNGGHILHL